MNIYVIAISTLLLQVPPALIQGTVIKSDGGEPLSKAIVELRTLESGSTPADSAITVEDGGFTFRNILPGRYRLVATRAGYVQTEFKSLISVGPGHQVTDLRLEMIPAGTIYGRITDRAGQPIANASVRALKATYPEGRRTLKTEQTAVTNDLGEYRLFWLAPGSYFVNALPSSSGTSGLAAVLTSGIDPKNDPAGAGKPNGPIQGIIMMGGFTPSAMLNKPIATTNPNEAYAPTYFPGTIDGDRASSIEVRPGTTVGSVDLTVTPVQTHHIRGAIINGVTRQPARTGQLRRARASALTECQSSAFNSDNCSFEPVDYDSSIFDIRNLTPGTYILYSTADHLIAQTTVEVSDSDIDNVVLALQPPITIAGRVTPPTPGVEVLLSPGAPLPEAPRLVGASLNDGVFSIRGLTPGDYRVRVSGVKNTYIQAIRSGKSDVLNSGLRVLEQRNEPLEIVLGTNPAVIDGHALSRQGEPVADVTVTLIPDAPRRHRADLYRTTQTDTSGHYHFADVAPGDYKLLAWENIETGAWQDPAFVRPYDDEGKSIHVSEGNQQMVDADVISQPLR
jgi:hypothetical protein